MLSSSCHHSSLPTTHTLSSGRARSCCWGVLQAAMGARLLLSLYLSSPEAFTIIYPICFFSPPPFQTHPCRPHQDAAYLPLGLPSHPPPQPARQGSTGTGHQADGQLGWGLFSGTAATCHVLLPTPCERWQQHGAEEHGVLAPRSLLHRNSGVCQQLQLGITLPAVCFQAQEPKSIFRGSKSVHLLF